MLSDHHKFVPVKQVPVLKWPLGIDDPKARAYLRDLFCGTVLWLMLEEDLLFGAVAARAVLFFASMSLLLDSIIWLPLCVYLHRTKSSGMSRFCSFGVMFVLIAALLKLLLHVWLFVGMLGK